MNSPDQPDRRARVRFPSDSPTAYTDLVVEVDRLTAKTDSLAAEVIDLRAKLSQMADDAVKVMTKSLRDVEQMQSRLEATSRFMHCPGTDGDCPRACVSSVCEIMSERKMTTRHGCG